MKTYMVKAGRPKVVGTGKRRPGAYHKCRGCGNEITFIRFPFYYVEAGKYDRAEKIEYYCWECVTSALEERLEFKPWNCK